MFKAGIVMQDDEGNWRLPNEVLLNILSLIDDRFNVSMTCKKFYEITCRIERYRRIVKINADKLDNQDLLNSVLNSERQCNQFLLDSGKLKTLDQLWRLKAISFKYGPSITQFTWESCKLTKAEIVNLIGFMPNLESLTAGSWKLQQEFYEETLPMLNLQRLKILIIVKSDRETTDFFTQHLPKNIIKEFRLQGEPGELLVNQTSIKKLSLQVDTFTYEELKNMELSHLILKLRKYKNEDGQSVLHHIVSNQPKLTHLKLIGCEGCFDGDDQAFAAICQLKELTSLKLNIDALRPEAFISHFDELKNLENLVFESLEHDYAPVVTIIDHLSHVKMQECKRLKFYFNDIGVPLDRIERIGQNFKQLENFMIRCDHPLPLDCYLLNMKHLKRLHVDYHYTKEFAKLCNNFDFKHVNLTELSLQGFAFGSDEVNSNEMTLVKLSETLPNLENLELDAAFPFNTNFIVKVLEKFPKLKILKNWSMVQSGEHYNKFDQVSVFNLSKIAEVIDEFSIELRLKAIDMDVSRVKDDLSKHFNVGITRLGSFIVIRLEKK